MCLSVNRRHSYTHGPKNRYGRMSLRTSLTSSLRVKASSEAKVEKQTTIETDI
jgi:hypothetical protein